MNVHESNLALNDAPGWVYNCPDEEPNGINCSSSLPLSSHGPNCWKCQGTKKKKKHKKQSKVENNSEDDCTVCLGKGYIPAKEKEIVGKSNPGVITRRSRYQGTSCGRPLPFAVVKKHTSTCREEYYNEAVSLVESAISDHVYMPKEGTPHYPTWIPQNGEELVNLVGSWRILQCVGSHRWTTDDLVTAFVASQEFLKAEDNGKLRYLDLGCGNGSVLQMTLWRLLQKFDQSLSCVGVEARKEAFFLAQRSISFNLGPYDDEIALCQVQLRNHDFRVLLESSDHLEKFDFITGTPPYFRIEYSSTDNSNINAVIKQGGMPTCLQSAPARCEFRGGIEAYSQVAEKMMKPDASFVVCEAWIHHKRVLKAADSCSLVITRVQAIEGKVGKPEPLFAVYVMRKKSFFLDTLPEMEILPHIAVRDRDGTWTKEYCSILENMGIPI